MTDLAWDSLATPVGTLSVACSRAGAAQVRFGRAPAGTAGGGSAGPARDGPPGAGQRAGRGSPEAGPMGAPSARALAAEAKRQLAEYFAGRRRGFTVPVDWSAVTGTHRQVLSALLGSACYGQVITYGDLAARAGVADEPGRPAARIVGQVMAANPCPVIVPCHRVVAGDGLGGYSGGAGPEVKRWLLIFEGSLPATLDWDPAGMTPSPSPS